MQLSLGDIGLEADWAELIDVDNLASYFARQ